MQVDLSPEWERFVAARIAAGEFDSPEAVVAAALDRLAAETDMLVGWDPEALRAEIQKGLDQLENGQSRVYDRDGLRALGEAIKMGVARKERHA